MKHIFRVFMVLVLVQTVVYSGAPKMVKDLLCKLGKGAAKKGRGGFQENYTKLVQKQVKDLKNKKDALIKRHKEKRQKKKEKQKQEKKRKQSISIASWNLHNLSLNANKQKLNFLNKYIYNLFTIQRADVVFLQEIRDTKGESVFAGIDHQNTPKVCDMVNPLDLLKNDTEKTRIKTAGFVRCISGPIGENSHKERYAILIHPLFLKKLKRFGIKTPVPKMFRLRGADFKRPALGVAFGKKLLILNVHLGHYGNTQESIIKRRQEAKKLRKRVTSLLNRYKAKDIIIAGDFNLDHTELSKIFKRYKDRKFHISTVGNTTSKNNYDHVITTLSIDSDIISRASSRINSTVTISDHKPIRVRLKLKNTQKK